MLTAGAAGASKASEKLDDTALPTYEKQIPRSSGPDDSGISDSAGLQPSYGHNRSVAVQSGVRTEGLAATGTGDKNNSTNSSTVVNCTGAASRVPLNCAVECGDIKMVAWLLQNGTEVNGSNEGLRKQRKALRFPGREGFTPLTRAAMYGLVDIARLLLESGAHVDYCDSRGMTPLATATARGNTELMQLLLDYQADINGNTTGWRTPLTQAARNGQVEAISLLLEHGADIHSFANKGGTPLNQATVHGHIESVRLLLNMGADANSNASGRGTPLCKAAGMGYIEIARLLVGHGANINSFDGGYFRSNSLSEAVSHGHVQLVKLLLEHGAQWQGPGNVKGLLRIAVEKACIEIVKLLLKYNAVEVNGHKYRLFSPLSGAVAKQDIELVELLLQSGADPDCNTFYRDYPPPPAGHGGCIRAT